MYCKKRWKYCIYFFIALSFIIGVTSFMTPININNNKAYFDILGLKIYDIGSLVALIIGLLAFFGTIYSVDRNYKSMKLSSLPEKSANLLIDLEFIFNEYENDEDNFKLLTDILKYWKDHQKAFRLLTPHFYKKFLKIISDQEKIKNNDSIYNINAQYVMMAIKAQITNIAFENENNIFSFIKPNLIYDDKNIENVGEDIDNYIEFKIEKNNFERYINNFEGENTQKLTYRKFKKFNRAIDCLLNDLKREIEEYD